MSNIEPNEEKQNKKNQNIEEPFHCKYCVRRYLCKNKKENCKIYKPK